MTEAEFKKEIKSLRKTIAMLRKDGNEFFNKILLRDKKAMFTYPKDKLHLSWRFDDLYHHCKAAQTLGYSVIIEVDDDGLHTHYVKKLPTTRPYMF